MLMSGGGDYTGGIMGAASRGDIRLAGALLVRAWRLLLGMPRGYNVFQTCLQDGGYMDSGRF